MGLTVLECWKLKAGILRMRVFRYRVRVTGGKIGTEQAARGWAAGHRQDEVR